MSASFYLPLLQFRPSKGKCAGRDIPAETELRFSRAGEGRGSEVGGQPRDIRGDFFIRASPPAGQLAAEGKNARAERRGRIVAR